MEITVFFCFLFVLHIRFCLCMSVRLSVCPCVPLLTCPPACLPVCHLDLLSLLIESRAHLFFPFGLNSLSNFVLLGFSISFFAVFFVPFSPFLSILCHYFPSSSFNYSFSSMFYLSSFYIYFFLVRLPLSAVLSLPHSWHLSRR